MRYFEKIKYSFTVVNSVFIFSKCLYLKTLNKSSLSFSKITFFGLFLFFGFSGISQVDSLECDKGIQKAIQDSEEGIYNSYQTEPLGIDWCRPTIDEVYSENEVEIAKSNYNINLISTPKGKTSYNLCYGLKMDSLIKEKYGDSIFLIIFKEANIGCDTEPMKAKDGSPIYYIVDTMPEFTGGQDSLNSFIQKNINPNSYEHPINGIVYCSFVVNIDGSLTDFRIENGVNEELDNEAIRILKLMHNWNPGSLNGTKVRVKWTIPIKFTG